ncbi:hypothetical protein KI387_012723, partial [Taxus chinensis]
KGQVYKLSSLHQGVARENVVVMGCYHRPSTHNSVGPLGRSTQLLYALLDPVVLVDLVPLE